jgi:hypothetical protein
MAYQLLFQTNTYQVIITSGDGNSTYVTYLYDQLQYRTGRAGISGGLNKIELPGSGTDANLLRQMSNIGQAGKWMYRVDGVDAVVCPAGLIEPPLCGRGT